MVSNTWLQPIKPMIIIDHLTEEAEILEMGGFVLSLQKSLHSCNPQSLSKSGACIIHPSSNISFTWFCISWYSLPDIFDMFRYIFRQMENHLSVKFSLAQDLSRFLTKKKNPLLLLISTTSFFLNLSTSLLYLISLLQKFIPQQLSYAVLQNW